MHPHRHPFSGLSGFPAVESFAPCSFVGCSPCWAWLCMITCVGEPVLVITNMVHHMFGPKSPRFGSLTLRRRRSKQTCWRGRISCLRLERIKERQALLTIDLSYRRLRVSIRLLQRTPCPPLFHHDPSEYSSVGRQFSECYVQRMASSSITIAVDWLPGFSRCTPRVQRGLSNFRLHDLVEQANGLP